MKNTSITDSKTHPSVDVTPTSVPSGHPSITPSPTPSPSPALFSNQNIVPGGGLFTGNGIRAIVTLEPIGGAYQAGPQIISIPGSKSSQTHGR